MVEADTRLDQLEARDPSLSAIRPWIVGDAKVIREMIFKENEFLNSRITWLVTLQGLLFTALSLAWKDGNWEDFNDFIPVIVTVGFFTSFAAVPLLYFTHDAIYQLQKDWKDHKPPRYNGPDVIGHFSNSSIEEFFSEVSLWYTLPSLFMAAWVSIFIYFMAKLNSLP